MTKEVKTWTLQNCGGCSTLQAIEGVAPYRPDNIFVVEASHLQKALAELSAAQKQIQEMQDNCISRSLHESRMWALEKRYQHMLKEQCRINGIGQERELKLMAELSAANKELEGRKAHAEVMEHKASKANELLRLANKRIKELEQCCKDFEFVLEGSVAEEGQSDATLEKREDALLRALGWDSRPKTAKE